MNEYKDNLALAATALVLSAALTLAWIAGLWVDTGSSLVRGGLVTVWLLAVGGAVGLLLRRTSHSLRTALHVLDWLGRHYEAGPTSAPPPSDAPDLSPQNPWFEVVDRLRRTLAASHERWERAEQNRAALEIRAQRHGVQSERATAILSSLAEPVVVVDEYDELILANTSAEKLFRFSAGDAPTRALAQLTRCEKLLELLGDSRRRQAPANRTDEVELVDADGRARWFNMTASPILPGKEAALDRGGSLGTVAVFRDITSHKAMQKRNAEFVSAVSHEMKTPLAGIKAYVEMLVDGDAEEEETREEFLQVINAQADRLRRLIDNLLNLARIESGVVKVNKQNCSVNELLEEAVSLVRPAAEEKHITLVCDLSPLYLGAHVDRDQMLQAAINLLSNAIKYTHDGGRVALRSRLVDRQVQFDVEDTGVGLSEEDRVRVFEKFYRVQKDKQMAPGTGLGLPLCKYIVHDVHGGRLTVDSTLGVGSTFTVTLPSAGQRM